MGPAPVPPAGWAKARIVGKPISAATTIIRTFFIFRSFFNIQWNQDTAVGMRRPCVGAMGSTELQGREIDRRTARLSFA
jgi:hypothetical protein